jgi:hypothetical protein
MLADIARWVRSRPDLRVLALIGSYAAGKARPDSDIDLVLIANAPEAYQNIGWVRDAVHRRPVAGTRSERFGNVWSLFATLAEGPEIEFTFAERSWAKADPPAPEVCRVLRDGIVVLHDPHGELLALSRACGIGG